DRLVGGCDDVPVLDDEVGAVADAAAEEVVVIDGGDLRAAEVDGEGGDGGGVAPAWEGRAFLGDDRAVVDGDQVVARIAVQVALVEVVGAGVVADEAAQDIQRAVGGRDELPGRDGGVGLGDDRSG